VIQIALEGDVIEVLITYPDSALMYKVIDLVLILLSGECLLKNYNYLSQTSKKNVSLTPIEFTSKLIHNFKLEGTDE
jgi:hypothetical protein